MSQFSGDFYALLDTVRDGIEGISTEIIEDEAFPRIVPEWFVLLHQVIRASVPLLEFAQDQLERYGSDPFIVDLRKFYEHKIEEETGHDDMLLADLDRVGKSPGEVLRIMPSPLITAMVGSQYYLIGHVHPAAFLGYLGLLEGYPARLDQLEHVVRRSALPAEAWATYRMHAEVDPWHREEIEEMLDQVPEQLRDLITANAVRTGEFYCQALEALLHRIRAGRGGWPAI